ncbi:MAG: hydrogenase maturation protein [Betaproteobacteria bacterium]|nr:hydrogenase maturation protein [Betaproteobacteria bacterium]
MKILFLTHSFNSLAQRLFVELTERGHQVSIEFDVNDRVSEEAVELFRPDLILAPFLKRAIPESIWKRHVCIVLHPGIPGDRGPSALDWAILGGETEWGVIALQAAAEMDAGDVWATARFPMRAARKSSLYRNEVTEAAVTALLTAVERFASGAFRPEPLDYGKPEVRGRLQPLMTQQDRAVDWSADTTAAVVRKIRSADGFPGVLDMLFDEPYFLFNAFEERTLWGGAPGQIIATRHGAILRATVDGAVWITHLKKKPVGSEPTFKLPAATVLGEKLAGVPESALPALPAVHPHPGPLPPAGEGEKTWRDIWYEEKNGVGYLHFDFYNGAMGTEDCARLRAALLEARQRPTRVLVLRGGADFWSNGIHLNLIEVAASPADESWRNINAMDDLTEAILTTDEKITIAALQGNAGAGGVFLALAADRVFARQGIVLNPHYKSMGNLYGSEYWTYLLPKRVGDDQTRAITQNRLPIGTPAAKRLGLIDDCFGHDIESFRRGVEGIAEALAASPDLPRLLADKAQRRRSDEAEKPLARYREEELARMKLNFYGFDPSYHVARHNFVYKVCHSRTPLHLALHRRPKWKRPAAPRKQEIKEVAS